MDAVQVLDGLRVLAVDDDPDNLELIKVILEQCHAQVIPAASASEALQVITWWKPNILISDIAMPIEDGYSPDYGDALTNLAQPLWEQGFPQEARASLEKALKIFKAQDRPDKVKQVEQILGRITDKS